MLQSLCNENHANFLQVGFPGLTQGIDSYFNYGSNSCSSHKQVTDIPGASASSFIKWVYLPKSSKVRDKI